VCTILLAWRCAPDAPVVLAANRDEDRGRASAAPAVLAESPRIAGGRDLVAGGTWLAVAADGRVAAVTNRRSRTRAPARRSRGELPLAVLRASGGGPRPEASAGGAGDAAVRRLLEGVDAASYNPVNVLALSRTQALVGHGAAVMTVVELQPGPHVLAVDDVDQPDDPRVEHLLDRLREAVGHAADARALLLAMEAMLRDPEWACVHGDPYGTVSSSSVLVPEAGEVVYRHAGGRPCVTRHEDLSRLLRG
jgi:uncharacterized protein with NRDE domain